MIWNSGILEIEFNSIQLMRFTVAYVRILFDNFIKKKVVCDFHENVTKKIPNLCLQQGLITPKMWFH